MFHYIKGHIVAKIDGGVVIEASGIGYKVSIPDNSSLYLRDEKEEITVFIEMIVREDDVSLYGFADEESMKLFQKLRTVNGVGAKAAMAILSAMSPSEAYKAIVFEDMSTLIRANGIGKKTAQRIVLELKDKLGELAFHMDGGDEVTIRSGDGVKGEAIEGLMVLGYSRSEAAAAVAAVDEEGLTAEECLKKALRGLSIKL
ncbi:MAG: Holliday junction branch migration protein RuvA [Anaerovoracaceae bacterium]|jgi:Holliday junction DNA helicase RuvA